LAEPLDREERVVRAMLLRRGYANERMELLVGRFKLLNNNYLPKGRGFKPLPFGKVARDGNADD